MSEEETNKVREIIKKLDSYIDLIATNLNTQITEQLHQQIENITWIGLENDYPNSFQDLEDALSQLNNVLIGCFCV